MMKWFMHPLLALIANATEAELAKYVEFLKVENQILRDRLPKRIETTEAERDKLIKVGRPLGHKVKQLISIVTPRTFLRWVQAEEESRLKEKEKPTKLKTPQGGNRKPEEIRELVTKVRKETGWGGAESRVSCIGSITNAEYCRNSSSGLPEKAHVFRNGRNEREARTLPSRRTGTQSRIPRCQSSRLGQWAFRLAWVMSLSARRVEAGASVGGKATQHRSAAAVAKPAIENDERINACGTQ